MMQQAKTIGQAKVWISWSGGIDSKMKGAERRKQRLGMVLIVRMGEDEGANVRAEHKFDEEENDEEEFEPSLFYDETCLSKEVFADLDLPPVFDEEVFDKESMIAYFDLPPIFDEEIFDKKSMSADFDPKPELVEEGCHAAKVDKEASLGIGDRSAPKFNNIGVVDSGNTTEEYGSAMVVRLVCSAYLSKIRG
ncbi:hypothetical protein LWI29_026460 [Acer saccharum]|uniref:Uncharacterized protein n=1 Tax=Acer saccharum TaxID=4024 RepID=A0AA39W023_ACESA|nr:hypothetical protein LWI29_026460 [Acer saccharum]